MTFQHCYKKGETEKEKAKKRFTEKIVELQNVHF